MTKKCHPRHALLVDRIEAYVRERRESARWFGLLVAKDAKLVPNLKRGQHIRPTVLYALWQRVGGDPVPLPPTLQKGTTVRFEHPRLGVLTGTVRGTGEFRSGLWVNIMHGEGMAFECIRVRASAVLAEIAPERAQERLPATVAA